MSSTRFLAMCLMVNFLSCQYNPREINNSNLKENSLNPDTALAVFLWDDTIPDFANSLEEYTRLKLEHSKIIVLYGNLYNRERDFSKRLQGLLSREEEFDEFIKTEIIKEANEYGSLFDSRELYYLYVADRPFYDSMITLYPKRRSESIFVD